MNKIKSGDLLDLKVVIRHKRVSPDLLIGQCIELPFIIVKGKTIDSLVQKVGEHLQSFFNTFPDKAEKILAKFAEKVEQPTTNQPTEWELREQLIQIPAR